MMIQGLAQRKRPGAWRKSSISPDQADRSGRRQKLGRLLPGKNLHAGAYGELKPHAASD